MWYIPCVDSLKLTEHAVTFKAAGILQRVTGPACTTIESVYTHNCISSARQQKHSSEHEDMQARIHRMWGICKRQCIMWVWVLKTLAVLASSNDMGRRSWIPKPNNYELVPQVLWATRRFLQEELPTLVARANISHVYLLEEVSIHSIPEILDEDTGKPVRYYDGETIAASLTTGTRLQYVEVKGR